jgi:hypothetical protein
MNDQNLEQRVKRLELLHFWGLTAIAITLAVYVVYKESK